MNEAQTTKDEALDVKVSAHMIGFVVGREGGSLFSNPHSRGSYCWIWWRYGWIDGVRF